MAGIFLFLGLVWGVLYAPLAHTSDAGGLFAFAGTCHDTCLQNANTPFGLAYGRIAHTARLFLPRYTHKDVG